MPSYNTKFLPTLRDALKHEGMKGMYRGIFNPPVCVPLSAAALTDSCLQDVSHPSTPSPSSGLSPSLRMVMLSTIMMPSTRRPLVCRLSTWPTHAASIQTFILLVAFLSPEAPRVPSFRSSLVRLSRSTVGKINR